MRRLTDSQGITSIVNNVAKAILSIVFTHSAPLGEKRLIKIKIKIKCHMSCVKCQMSHVTCGVLHVKYLFLGGRE